MITQHLNKENTRWVFIPNSSPDIWTGAGYRKANNNNNGIPLTSVLPSSSSSSSRTQFNPNSDDNKVNSKPTTYSSFTQQYQSHQWLKQCVDFHQ
ncbi:MgPa adhesin [Mycoplasmoides genitalium M2321]|nr:MgPa adhesin [Mycoplasmoides genitalium M2321]